MEKYYCNSCRLIFSSGLEMAEHFRSKEHRDTASGKNLDSLIEKFIVGIKNAINPNQMEEEQK